MTFAFGLTVDVFSALPFVKSTAAKTLPSLAKKTDNNKQVDKQQTVFFIVVKVDLQI